MDTGDGEAVSGTRAASARVEATADEYFAHLLETSAGVRLRRGLPITEFEDITIERARRDARWSRERLERLEAVPMDQLPHDGWLLARMLRHTFASSVHTDEDYWLRFEVTPYSAGFRIPTAHRILAAQPMNDPGDRENYLHLVDEYVELLEQMAEKTSSQAERGIRVPRPAIEGVVLTLRGFRDSAPSALTVDEARLGGLTPDKRAAFESALAERIGEHAVPAYDRLLGIFDEAYRELAPAEVGVGQFPGGKEYYERLIVYGTGLELTPREVHERGLAAVAELERRMREIRSRLGFDGDRRQFHKLLRTDERFLARTPEEVERRYREHLARIEPRIPAFFSRLPKAPYGVKRLDPAAEAGMTYGYYQLPTAKDPVGYYRYNGSRLDQRSLVTAAHLIYHELVPGHHFHVALQSENAEREDVHPLREFLFYGAFNEGWAEYAASVAGRMGGYEDPYDLYGHHLIQILLAVRLVVDTGLNYFGWSLEEARAYMREHTLESDVQIASESLRYSTDIYALSALHWLGYEKFRELRRRAETAIGEDFDLRAFHEAAVGSGAMPLDVLDAHIDRFIARWQAEH